MRRPTYLVKERQSRLASLRPSDLNSDDFVVPRPSELAAARAEQPAQPDVRRAPGPRRMRHPMARLHMPRLATTRMRWTPPRLPWQGLSHVTAMVAVIALVSLLPLSAAGSGNVTIGDLLVDAFDADPAAPQKVALIVGPVGEELTPIYITIAEAAATRATELGATVTRAYSPEATPENVIAAVEGANIVVYLGHGVGFPNPYSETLNPDKVNGFGLQGPNARGDNADSWQDGTLAYYGEAWLTANARPAPGWVMIHSNVCYAPGAGEGFEEPASPETAALRVANYSRAPLLEMGAAAYFATDFYMGAAEIIGSILSRPEATFGEVFASESRYLADAVSRVPHGLAPNAEIWLQRSPYFEGKVDYWYAFAGDPNASPASVGTNATLASGGGAAQPAPIPYLPPVENGTIVGTASHYAGDPGWEGQPTVSLPLAYGGGQTPTTVVVCADRCEPLLVVDSCDCFVGTPDVRVINLSHQAWQMVTDRPLSDGLVAVSVQLIGSGQGPSSWPPDR